MSLYYDAVSILTTPTSTGGSFKSRLYNSRTLKASPAQIYALITEAAKWDLLLKEVIEQSGLLKLEPKLTPLLSLLLVHDHLLAKNGIAAPASHPLRQAVERHKIRLKGEFTKARVRRACASVEELREAVRREKLSLSLSQGVSAVYPRWVRINNVRTTLEAQLGTTFAAYARVDTLGELVGGDGEPGKMCMRLDPHIPDLVAVAPGVDFSASPAYRNGEIILQDKASCFPAYLLIGDGWAGDLLDGCAAPGNKTTHLASLLCKNQPTTKAGRKGVSSHIFSMDASKARAKTLQKMVSTAGADKIVTVLPGQDFLALDPDDPRFKSVTGLLLDPSCSGSGIIGRDDVPQLTLPATPATAHGKTKPTTHGKKGRKRKRDDDEQSSRTQTSATDENENELSASNNLDPDRLVKLSNLQTRIVQHALGFPAATRVTYSTCSIHVVENESVVSRVLASEVAKRRGWRVLRRDEQPRGLREWRFRGVRREDRTSVVMAVSGQNGDEGSGVGLSDEELEGCLRCWPGDEEGTGGFFVVGFVRDAADTQEDQDQGDQAEKEDGEDEWEGFSD